jgi:hypothetical protein
VGLNALVRFPNSISQVWRMRASPGLGWPRRKPASLLLCFQLDGLTVRTKTRSCEDAFGPGRTADTAGIEP